MDRRKFLSISGLSLVAATGIKCKAHIVALPFHLTRHDSLRKNFLEASNQIHLLSSLSEPLFYYYRPSELSIVHQAFDLGLVQEIWTTPPLLTLLHGQFAFTGALGVGEPHLEKLSWGLRHFLSPDISLSYFSLPSAKYYFAETSAEPPDTVQCFYPFRQALFGDIDPRQPAILDCLPLAAIKKRPELNGAKLYLDTFSHPLTLGLVIKKDHCRRDFTNGVISTNPHPQVPGFLNSVYERFQENSLKLVDNFWKSTHSPSLKLG